MADYDIIRKFPFSLSEEQAQWVKNTIEGMSLDEKSGSFLWQETVVMMKHTR